VFVLRFPAYSPEWLTYEVSQALAAIAGEHVAKKEATVLRLAEALANGVSMNSVFERPDTCSKRAWYGYTDTKTGKVKPAWRDDAAIDHALAMATERARWWVRVKRGRAVENALDILMDGAEHAALQLVQLVRHGYVKFDYGADGAEIRNADVREVLMASEALLDRVSALTAGKAGAPSSLNSDQLGELMRKAKLETAELVLEAEEGWDEDSAAPA
jgi:hypothetical protein